MLEQAATTPALRAAAKEAVILTELRSEVFRCLSLALNHHPVLEDGPPTQGVCAVLAAASIVEIHVASLLRTVRDQLLAAAQSGKPMEASKYFKALLAVEDGSSEFLGSELSALCNIEDLQLTGLVRADSGAPPRTSRVRNRGNGSRSNGATTAASQQSLTEVSSGPHSQQRGCGKGQSPQRDGGAGPQK